MGDTGDVATGPLFLLPVRSHASQPTRGSVTHPPLVARVLSASFFYIYDTIGAGGWNVIGGTSAGAPHPEPASIYPSLVTPIRMEKPLPVQGAGTPQTIGKYLI